VVLGVGDRAPHLALRPRAIDAARAWYARCIGRDREAGAMYTFETLTRDEMRESVRALNGLIEVGRDAQRGFDRAARDVCDPEMREPLARTALQRAQFVDELQRAVRAFGAFAEDEGTLLGALHRGWLDAKAVLEDGSVRGVLSECERGELAARRAYEHALRAPLPIEVRDVVQKQYAAVRDSLDRLREKIDALEHAPRLS
jgi:uncharacterized protein (TIGR02284 family)